MTAHLLKLPPGGSCRRASTRTENRVELWEKFPQNVSRLFSTLGEIVSATADESARPLHGERRRVFVRSTSKATLMVDFLEANGGGESLPAAAAASSNAHAAYCTAMVPRRL